MFMVKCVLYFVNPYLWRRVVLQCVQSTEKSTGEVFTGEGGQGSPVGRDYMSMAKERESHTFWLEYLPSQDGF
jgi:hypothetical protein